jgi:hypothetical protein
VRPPDSPAIPLVWSELLYYSLREHKGRDGEVRPIQFASVRPIRSAVAHFYTMDMQSAYPRWVMRDRHRRGMVLMDYVSPTDELYCSFGATGMATRMGTEAKKSWALSHVHITYIEQEFEGLYTTATKLMDQHDAACGACVHLLAYLGWLQSGEILQGQVDDYHVTAPQDGPSRNLPPGIGAIEARLLASTKSDPTLTADVVIAFSTPLSGLSLGKWLQRLQKFTPYDSSYGIFSTAKEHYWSSRYFRETYAYPFLKNQRLTDEPTLQTFTHEIGKRIRDTIYSMHSWRRAGRSRVSRSPRHNHEPKPRGTRRATPDEVYEHGRWQVPVSSENMPRRYNQWDLCDWIGLTLHRM